jgi:hypothetical protein
MPQYETVTDDSMDALAIVPETTPDLDAICGAAVDVARAAAVDVAGADLVGDHLGAESEGERIVTHYFASNDRAYVGWRWAVTVVRPPRSKTVTVDEVVLLPGAGALLAPTWLPWSDRLQAGDLGVGDVLPTAAEDERLTPGYAGVFPHDELDDDRAALDELVHDLWLGRPRVMSLLGREEAAQRWYEGDHGPQAPIARASEMSCATCGFLLLMRGALSRVFGVCGNEFAPDDGRVVSFDHGCGAHSEALVIHTAPQSGADEPAPPSGADEPAPPSGELAVEPEPAAAAEPAPDSEPVADPN